MTLPLQPIRTFGVGEDSLNRLIFGDNLQALKSLLRLKQQGGLRNPDGSHGFKLIYLDPPFATARDFAADTEELAYADKVVGAKFVEFLRRRLILMRELLAPDGNLYVHLDEKKSHYIKVILDEVLGEHRFQREIIWRIGWVSGYKTQAKNWIRNHDVVLFYSLDTSSFNKRYIPYPADYLRRDGKRPTGAGYPYEDTWNSSPLDELNSIQIVSFSGEKTGFPTQKNEALVARIIEAGSKEGEYVLDPFCGSGTTLAVAEKMGRTWMGIDSAKVAIYTTQRRLLNLRKNIGNTGDDLPPADYTLYNSGIYDFKRLRDLPWEEWREFALSLFECVDKPHQVHGVRFDGFRHAYDVLIFDHTRGGGATLDHGYIASLHEQVSGRSGDSIFIIAPAARVAFLEDYVDHDDTRYYVLRIPYSIINELHTQDFEYLTQPFSEKSINRTVEAVGFDFIRPPKVDALYQEEVIVDEETQEEETVFSVTITSFKSQASNLRDDYQGLDALSMVLVDQDYDFDSARKDDGQVQPFQLDTVFWGSDLRASEWKFALDDASTGDYVMLIYIDVYGNEHVEVKGRDDFSSRPKARRTRKSPAAARAGR